MQQIGLGCVGMPEPCPLAVSVPGQSPARAAPLQEVQEQLLLLQSSPADCCKGRNWARVWGLFLLLAVNLLQPWKDSHIDGILF